MRNILDVTKEIVEQIPETESNLIDNMNQIAEDSIYRAPEIKHLSWDELSWRLNHSIGEPTLDWHYEVYSILTTKSVAELKG